MKLLATIVLSAAVLSAAIAGQDGAVRFEVAAVRPVQIGGQPSVSVGLRTEGEQVRVGAFTFREYVALAYRVRPYQVVGPDWITSDRFDLQARLPAGTTADQVLLMLQSLLTERFALKMHRDSREMAVHALVVGKPPLRLTEKVAPAETTQPAGPANVAVSGNADGVVGNLGNGATYAFSRDGRFEATRMTMSLLAGTLERFGDRPVVDMTNLKGIYDFAITFMPDDYQPIMIRSAVNAGVPVAPQARELMEAAGNPLVNAIEQIGLKLDPRRAPVAVIVVDDARRTPTEN